MKNTSILIIVIYIVIGFIQSKDIIGCKVFNKETGECSRCYLGYQLKIHPISPKSHSKIAETSCLKCNFGCSQCSLENQYECIECFEGFYLETYTKQCHRCDQSCAKCTEMNTNCELCMEGYYREKKGEDL